MSAAAVHAILIVAATAALFAAVVVIAYNWATLARWADERLAGWLSPPPGDHHKFAAPDAERITETPAPGAEPGQAPGPAATPPWQPAPLPQPEAGASPSASPGPGQHPSGGHRKPWVTWHQPPAGSLLAIGYEPFHHGPRAVIPSPRVSLRVTGELPALGGDAPAIVRRYRADLEKWWDKPVNES